MTASRIDLRAELIEAVKQADGRWDRPSEAFRFGDTRWLPDLVHTDGRLLHLVFDQADHPWRKRMAAARQAGRTLVIGSIAGAVTLDVLVLMQDLDAQPLLIDFGDDGTATFREFSSVADFVARTGLALSPEGRARLGEALLDRALETTDTYLKGIYFEQVLCLLFSQVSFFDVLEHRYVNDEEELDLVLANQATSPHIIDLIRGAIVLVSGKNHKATIGAPAVRDLRGNMAKRRGRCKLGILCAAGELASTASKEQQHATDDPLAAVALIDGAGIRKLLKSHDLDDEVAEYLREAVLT